MSKYQPKFARVLIKREIKEKTTGGIILPNAKRYSACTGEIVALGETAGFTESYNEDGSTSVIRAFNVGDKVVFGRHSGAWLDATYKDGQDNDDGSLFICQDQDILAVIKE